VKQENSTAGDDEVQRERKDDELDLTRKNKHQTTNQVRKANQSYHVTRCAGNGKNSHLEIVDIQVWQVEVPGL